MSKIRILQINKLYHPWVGGIESVIKDVAEGLDSRTDMQVLVCKPKGRTSDDKVNGIKVFRSGSLGMLFSMPISLSFPFHVRKFAAQADVIIVHDPFPLGDLAVLLSGFKGKVILWWHSDIVKQKRLLKLIEPIIHGILRRADVIFVTTEGYIDGSAYIPEYRDKCRFVPYGIDTEKYLSIKKTPILSDKRTYPDSIKVLFVGRLVYYKGCDVLLEAFKAVDGAELFIVGTGADEEKLRIMAEPVSDRVHFMGNLPDDELKCAFADCDIFVLPSVEKSEAFGIVQLEAMVYGKPVINTDLKTSVPRVSLHNQTGLTVKAGSVSELADAIRLLTENEPLRRQLGENAAERIKKHFDRQAMLNSVLEVCKEIAE